MQSFLLSSNYLNKTTFVPSTLNSEAKALSKQWPKTTSSKVFENFSKVSKVEPFSPKKTTATLLSAVNFSIASLLVNSNEDGPVFFVNHEIIVSSVLPP